MNRSLRSRLRLLSAALLLPVAAASAQTISGFSPTYGRIGDSFTISGTGLATATAVQINGETMPFTVNTLAGTLTVKVPPQASTGLVRVTTSAGTATTSKGFRVTRLSTSLSFPAQAAVSGAGTTGDFSTLCLGDLDDDNLLDLVVGFGVYNGGANSGTLRRYEQTSATDGNFGTNTTGVLLTTSTVSNGIAGTKSTLFVANFAKPYITDLEGDGFLDLLIGDTNGNVLLYEQANTLTFDPNNFESRGTLFPNPEPTVADGYYCRPTVVDLDGDGLLDVLVGANHGKIRRYEQKTAQATVTANFNSLGFLQDVTSTATDLDAGAVSKAQVLDIEGDGLLDLLVGNSDGNLLQYQQTSPNAVTFKRIGTGNFNGIALGATQYAAPVMADVDGDGLMDLLLGSYNVAANTAGGNAAGANALRFEQTNNATSTPLPVTLTSFTGSAATAGNQLRWATAQEVNSARFVVERSADGLSYQDVASVAAAGNSASGRSYQYLDATSQRTAYYRLRQVDTDGKTAYSSVVVVTRAATTAAPALVAFPNPFEGELLVALPAGASAQAATVSLTTLAGQTVYSRTLDVSGVAQALPGLPALKPGVYVLRLTTATGSSTLRVVRR
ncbi:T9SS type A sorting domain-containing protein [Hymenobacter pini]|uniref:T9SS type A sorting domain-containing protein n=1 Tax=Hymenobacter pini TaxID=2880879 RepID=UPI001CF17603|nr:T9SS type A sorting domain-containing protein [Hymenobacter pini]MCA8829161.1 T9SS type A sorting domain-containing protein [Hymenobacter pini]